MTAVKAAPSVPSRRALVTVWLSAAVGFAVLLGVAQILEGPVDDRDQAEQRVGFIDEGPLPIQAATVVSGLPARGRSSVVLFLRAKTATAQCKSLARSLRDTALVAVLSGPAPCPGIAAVLVDPQGRTSRAYGMRSPVDGGPPAGYAVVDTQTRVRYRTLDPRPSANSREIRTILAAL